MKRTITLYLRKDNAVVCIGLEVNGKQHITYDLRQPSGKEGDWCLGTSKKTQTDAQGKDMVQLIKDLQCTEKTLEVEVTEEGLVPWGVNNTWIKHPELASYASGISAYL